MENRENRQVSSPKESFDWPRYYEATANRPPNSLLVEAMAHITGNGKVLDLGAGSGVDARYLAEKGYAVIAVDSSVSSSEYFQNNEGHDISFIQADFSEYDFPKDEFILVSAQYALPFIGDKEKLIAVLYRIKDSLKKKGIFTGQLFGDQSRWINDDESRVRFTKEEVDTIFSDMDMIKFQEQLQNGKTVLGQEKHWQVFNIIAQKK